MKRFLFSLTVGLIVVSLAAADSDARGGRGGGGRGGGGRGGGRSFSGGGRSFSGGGRSPSMSRPSASRRPSSSRPSVSRPSYPSRPSGSRPSTRPGTGVGSRPGGGTTRPSTGIGTRPGGGNRPTTGIGNRPGAGGPNRPGAGGPSRPGTGTRPGSGRPTQGQLQNFLNLPGGPTTLPAQPGGGQRPGGGRPGGDRPNRPGGGDRPGRPGGDRPGGGDRPNRPGGDRPGRPDGGDRPNRPGGGDRPGRPGDRPGRPGAGRPGFGDSARNRWANRPNRPFGRNYWNRPGYNNRYWRWQRYWGRFPGYYWWRPCTWAAVGAWLPWAWANPYYYDYGTTIVYRDGGVYYGDDQVATADAYYQQADQLADSIPADTDAETADWLPLGVFAVGDGAESAESHMLLQLAVSKQGIIAGTMYNETTGSERPVDGMVDKESQRAAWKFSDDENQDIVMETGIYNLTQDETKCLVHHGPDKTQTWTLVRLPEPKDDQAQPELGTEASRQF